MEEKLELMYSWIEDVRGFDDRSALHRDLLSVQIRMLIDGWLTVVDVHDHADSMAADSSF